MRTTAPHPRFHIINCTGRLVADATLKELPGNGGSVCEVRIAVDGLGRGGRDQAGYIDVHSYGDSGKAAAKILSKGWLVAVNGRLQHEVYERDGQKRSAYRVIGHVEFLAAPRSNGDTQSNDDWRADLPEQVPLLKARASGGRPPRRAASVPPVGGHMAYVEPPSGSHACQLAACR
jgi:single-strand DNA-binding protein